MENNILTLEERVIERGVHPTSTVSQSRVPVVCGNKRVATQKTKSDENFITIGNKYGTMSYNRQRLTQVHRDIMDWIFAFSKSSSIKDGYWTYNFNAYSLRRDTGIRYEDWERLLSDLATSEIKIQTKTHILKTVIITERKYDEEHEGQKIGAVTRGQDYQVTFSRGFMKFFDEDLNVYYDKLLPAILAIKDAKMRGIIRFLITHDDIQIGLRKVLTVIDTLRPDQEKTYQNRVLREVRNNVAVLAQFGITLDKFDNLHYSQHKDVWFLDPLKDHTENQTVSFKNKRWTIKSTKKKKQTYEY